MTLPLYLTLPLLALWLLAPLLMRPAFRNAGLPPTAAATAVLALMFCGAMIVFPPGAPDGPGSTVGTGVQMAPMVEEGAVRPALMLDLALVGLALSGAALLTKGLMQRSSGGFGLRMRRWMTGLGAYAFHAGIGLIATLAFSLTGASPRDAAGPLWPEQAETLAGVLLFVGAGLILLALCLTLLRRLRAS